MTKSRKKLTTDAPPRSHLGASSDGESAVLQEDGFAASEQIRLRAYELYRERGGTVGDDTGDWLQAEREYLALAPTARTARRDGHRSLDLTLPASEV